MTSLASAARAAPSSGLLDRSLAGGALTFDLGPGDERSGGIVLQPDGRIVFAGVTNDDGGSVPNDTVVTRLLVDGRVDESFGTSGRVLIRNFATADSRSMVLQDDGKIVMVGESLGWDGEQDSLGLSVVRLTPEGALDTTFQGGQVIIFPTGGWMRARTVSLQPDGKIVAAGSGQLYRITGRSEDFAIARLNTDGSPDVGFGDNGFVLTDFGGWEVFDTAASIAVQPDGKIVAGGVASVPYFGGEYPPRQFVLARYSATGVLDPTFDQDGKVVTMLSIGGTTREGLINAIALQPDGKIVAAGESIDFLRPYEVKRRSVTLARYRTDGSLDPAFGSGGLVSTPAPDIRFGGATWEGHAGAWATAIDHRGRIVSAGFAANSGDGDAGLVRHGPNGALDTTFGMGGWAKSDVNVGRNEIRAMVLQPDGRFLTLGTATVNGGTVLTVARYPSFDGPRGVSAWGSNAVGQVGDNTLVDRRAAVTAAGLGGGSELAAGVFHSLAVKNDGTVWAWGWNGFGQLGDGTLTNRYSPVRLPMRRAMRSVSAGAYHSLAVDAFGQVWAWGWNAFGQVGDGSLVTRAEPVMIPGLTGVSAVAAGAFHSLALKKDGTVWAWGWNAFGQLGDGTTLDRHVPVQVPGLQGVTGLVTGAHHGLAIDAEGSVRAWGRNIYGQLGDGTVTSRASPVLVPGLNGVTSLAAGFHHSLAVRSDGTAWAWGWNGVGQLGDGSTTERHVPVQVNADESVASIAAGGFHSLALTTDRRVLAWGFNHFGQLGNDSELDSHTPVPVDGLTGASGLAAGTFHSLVARPG